MSHNDELSLFLQEVADVRPLRSDHIAPVAGNSQPTEAQLARREAATAEQLTLDHLGTEAVEMLDPMPSSASSVTACRRVYKLRLGKYGCKAPSTCTTRRSTRPVSPWCSSLPNAKCGISAAC